MKRDLLFAACIVCIVFGARAASPSPYAGEVGRSIKALSPEEIRAYLDGKGMGYAKAAELNGYPGPAHVLELVDELDLTESQRGLTQALFASMKAEAGKYGQLIVEREQELDRLFAMREATPDALRASLEKIAALLARLRGVHLEAHLSQARILTPGQIARYGELRGYTSAPPAGGHEHRHH